MITFEEWLVQNHPEIIDENWKKKLLTGALMAGSALGGAGVHKMMTQNKFGSKGRPVAKQPYEKRSATSDDAGEYMQVRKSRSDF